MTGARGRLSVILIGTGVCVVVGGLLNRTGALSWFGPLPHGLRVGNERTRVRIPRCLDAQSPACLRPRRVGNLAPLLLIN
jgi:hypothetical protein